MSNKTEINNHRPTPATLKAAVREAILTVPLSQVDILSVAIVRDYLAQHFQAAFLMAKTGEETDLLQRLWLKIINEGVSQ